MAGKPELAVAQQTQAQSLQNVVVYVSNDNITHTYATAVGHPNGVTYDGVPQSVTQLQKNFVSKALKNECQQANGVLEGNGFYQTAAEITQNGFPQQCGGVSIYQNNINTSNAVLNHGNFVNTGSVKNVIGFNNSSGEVFSGSSVKQKCARDETSPTMSEGYAGASSDGAFVTVMGAETASNTANIVFPRCDSVRSETAESSCSSLSSGESQGDGTSVANAGLVLLPPPASTSVQPSVHSSQPTVSGDMLVYDNNGVSVGVRTGQPVMLTMVPPQQPVQQLRQQSVTVPLGWKRLHTNGVIIYVSPSNTALSSLEQVKEYLQTHGTCKCGLECPLKCDAVFNFDPKVAGKPWTMAPDTNVGDLTKLCNHKRKLLAINSSLSSPQGKLSGLQRSPATLVTAGAQQMQTAYAGAAPLDPNKLRKDGSMKRKKRKMGSSYSGVSVSQLLAQREKIALAQQQMFNKEAIGNQQTQAQMWQAQSQQITSLQQANNPNNGAQFIRYQNPNSGMTRIVQGPQMVVGTTMMVPQQGNTITTQQQQQMQQTIQQQQNLQNQQIINQQHLQQTIPLQQNHQMIHQQNVNQTQQQVNQNQVQQHQQQQHIIGPNGQIIAVQPQTNINGQNQMNMNAMNSMVGASGNVVIQGLQPQRIVLNNHTEDIHGPGRPLHHGNINVVNSNISSPHQQDAVQRIQNQQFYGQNISYQQGQIRSEDQIRLLQQQIDANKGIRQQFIPVSNANSNNTGAIFNNYRQDGIMQNSNQQMVVPSVSGTAVVIPQKTPPWQQNKINNMHQQNVLNQQHIIMQSQSVTNHQSNQNITGNVFERVPPLHHHTPPPPAWSDDTHRKKNKVSKSMKKRPYNLLDHQHRQDGQMACPNIDVRQIPSERPVQQMAPGTQSPSAGPSFMEDPSGYLAQQTALLNSTISRQTGINNGLNYMCHSPGTPQNSSQQGTPPQPSTPPVGVPIPSNVIQPQSKQIQYSMRNPTNMVVNKNHIQQHNNQHNNQIENSIPLSVSAAQCQACIATSENMHMQQQYSNRVTASNVRELQSSSRPNSQPSTPSSLSASQEDSPVTSSTYCEKFNNSHNPSPDTRPIQGGMISTSSGSPMEVFQPQSEPSSTPSTPVPMQQRSNQMQNMYVSSTSSSFVMPGQNSPNVYSLNNSVNTSRELNISQTQTTVSVPMSESLLNSHSNIGLSYTTSIPTSMQNMSKQQNQNNKSIEGYCPHPHAAGSPLGLQIPYQPRTVTTMASGRTVGSNTITSVLAGRAQTATVSVNTPAAMPSLNATQMSSMGQQSNPQMSQTISVSVSKSPLEMVQSVVSSIQVPHSQQSINIQSNQQMSPQQIVKHSPTQNLPSGHILVSSGGQLIMTNNGQGGIMPPPPPKLVNNNGGMPPISVSPLVTNVTASVTQVIPNVGMAQQVLGQQTVLVNALPTPFVIQPGVMTVDGMTVGQNVQLPQIVAGNVIQQQIQLDNADQNRLQSQNMSNRQPTLISPDSGKRKGKKRKMGSQTVASMLHVAAQQNSSVVMQQQQGFQPQSFQMAHSPQGVNTGPVLQALTIVPGKGGGPPQIVMNGQPGQSGPFSTQQLITGSQPTQQINLLQPVNLLNGATGVVQNFPTIQQFIVPGLGGMVMATDGSTTATLLPDTSSVGMQLQLQNVNGQNVLTPVQNTNGTVFGTANGQSILTAGPAGMVIRSPGTPQGKIIQQQHSPGAQFLSPNGGQFLMNGTQFNSQLSPLVANVSPTQQVTVRPANSVQHTQHEFIQCGQMGQTLMVPCNPNGTQNIAVSSASNQQNTTFVQQNTTIVQQQTTMVSNNQPVEHFPNQNNGQSPQNVAGSTTTMNLDQNFIVNSSQPTNDRSNSQQQANLIQQSQQNISAALLLQRHSVSTQTAVGQSPAIGTTVSAGAGSPPDTTTHSPLAPGADTTTHEGTSPSPPGCNIQRERQSSHSMAMVHCISSSEPDASDLISISGTSDPSDWGRSSSAGSITPKSVDCTEFTLMSTNHHMVHGTVRKSLTPTYVESSISVVNNEASVKSQEAIISSQKVSTKRKHSDALLVMETRHMHTLLQDDDPDESHSEQPSSSPVTFLPGELVWGAAHGCPAWPGKLVDGPSSADGCVWVRWFGSDRSPPAAVDPATLQTLTQGLDAHHKARKKCRKSRKLNSQLENAIQEAMAELDRISEQQKQKLNQPAQSSKSMTHNIINKKETTGRLRSSQR